LGLTNEEKRLIDFIQRKIDLVRQDAALAAEALRDLNKSLMRKNKKDEQERSGKTKTSDATVDTVRGQQPGSST